ncbi:uncharacterized protein LOC125947100 [Dermacentor silvarum]|uniref:uncharacterized protein LOC125947100 n=1 Tax=Dermacentor silvarum TaxID=543639 RepID=UPI002101157B|nr:uncharacterized protein LOC125947100 [Dermacentor silvarum]
MPPDDMCDFIFYTHMFYNTRTNRIEPQHGSTSAEQFMKVANSYKITTFGISLAVSLMPQFPPDQKDDIKKAMENLMNKKIMHFGALDVDVRDYDAAKSGGLQYLKAST